MVAACGCYPQTMGTFSSADLITIIQDARAPAQREQLGPITTMPPKPPPQWPWPCWFGPKLRRAYNSQPRSTMYLPVPRDKLICETNGIDEHLLCLRLRASQRVQERG